MPKPWNFEPSFRPSARLQQRGHNILVIDFGGLTAVIALSVVLALTVSVLSWWLPRRPH